MNYNAIKPCPWWNDGTETKQQTHTHTHIENEATNKVLIRFFFLYSIIISITSLEFCVGFFSISYYIPASRVIPFVLPNWTCNWRPVIIQIVMQTAHTNANPTENNIIRAKKKRNKNMAPASEFNGDTRFLFCDVLFCALFFLSNPCNLFGWLVGWLSQCLSFIGIIYKMLPATRLYELC